MTEGALLWMNQRYPQGFFCCNLTRTQSIEISWIDVVSLNRPLLLELDSSLLQDCISSLINAGLSAASSCWVLSDPALSGTLGDIAMKVRSFNLSHITLAVE